MALYGRMYAQNFYTTRLALVSAGVQEGPFELASDHSRTTGFHVIDEAMVRSFKRYKPRSDDIGPRDGEDSIFDEEWRVVEPIVVLSGPGFKYDPRAIVDAALAK